MRAANSAGGNPASSAWYAPIRANGGGSSAEGDQPSSTWSTPMVCEMTVRTSQPGHSESVASCSAESRAARAS